MFHGSLECKSVSYCKLSFWVIAPINNDAIKATIQNWPENFGKVAGNSRSWVILLTNTKSLACLLAHKPRCLACLRAHMPTCLACLTCSCAQVAMCLACSHTESIYSSYLSEVVLLPSCIGMRKAYGIKCENKKGNKKYSEFWFV